MMGFVRRVFFEFRFVRHVFARLGSFVTFFRDSVASFVTFFCAFLGSLVTFFRDSDSFVAFCPRDGEIFALTKSPGRRDPFEGSIAHRRAQRFFEGSRLRARAPFGSRCSLPVPETHIIPRSRASLTTGMALAWVYTRMTSCLDNHESVGVFGSPLLHCAALRRAFFHLKGGTFV